MLFRPTRHPAPSVTLGVRSVGHYRLRHGDVDRKAIKNFVQLFWSIKGSGVLRMEGRPFSLGPEMIAFYFPGDIHDVTYPASGENWECRWLTLDGDLALSIVRGFGFTNAHPYHAGAAPVALFEKLAYYLRDVTLTGELRAGALAFELLSEAAESAHPWQEDVRRKPRTISSKRLEEIDRFKTEAVRMIQQHWADPAYGVEQIAADLNCHRSLFSRKFHAAFGLPPSDYLLRWRIQNALNLLRDSDLPIATVARSCGWEDANYFARCIRKATGVSPREFRSTGAVDAAKGAL